MSSIDPNSLPSSKPGDPTWEAIHLLPRQGQWHEEDFLRLHSNRMAELVDGRLEVLPMPTWLHQLIVVWLYEQLKDHIGNSDNQGTVLVAPLPVKLFPGTIREPDVLYIATENRPAVGEKYPSKVDFAMEVVSEGSEARKRDYEDKTVDYAKAGVGEYWIVDPIDRKIRVHVLQGASFDDGTEFSAGQQATGMFFEAFSIDVDELLKIVDANQ